MLCFGETSCIIGLVVSPARDYDIREAPLQVPILGKDIA